MTVAVGDVRVLVLSEELTRTQIVQYAGASGDYNPVHTDERFATEAAGYPSVFAHGMLTMGMAGRVLTDWFGVEALLAYGVRFMAQVWPGDMLTATATITDVADQELAEIAHINMVVTNQTNDVVMSGTATARIGADLT